MHNLAYYSARSNRQAKNRWGKHILLALFFSHSLLHFLTVEKYGWLVDGAADDRIKTFIAEEHSFDEYAEVICEIV